MDCIVQMNGILNLSSQALSGEIVTGPMHTLHVSDAVTVDA